MKLCKDCKHYQKHYFESSLSGCNFINFSNGNMISRIYGSNNPARSFCNMERSDEYNGKCGRSGKNFTQKTSTLRRIINIIKSS